MGDRSYERFFHVATLRRFFHVATLRRFFHAATLRRFFHVATLRRFLRRNFTTFFYVATLRRSDLGIILLKLRRCQVRYRKLVLGYEIVSQFKGDLCPVFVCVRICHTWGLCYDFKVVLIWRKYRRFG
jgi:hypothetical protein